MAEPIVIERHLNCEREHVLDGECWCRPRVEEYEHGIVVIHNESPHHDA